MTRRHSNLRGMTLVEALVVLAILGLLAGLATLALRLPPGVVLDRTARGIAADLRQARAAALTRGEIIALEFDAGARRLMVPALGLARRLPQRVEARVTGAAAVQTGDAVAILFYPDASTSGGEIELGAGPHRRVLRVHWLTGQVLQDAP